MPRYRKTETSTQPIIQDLLDEEERKREEEAARKEAERVAETAKSEGN